MKLERVHLKMVQFPAFFVLCALKNAATSRIFVLCALRKASITQIFVLCALTSAANSKILKWIFRPLGPSPILNPKFACFVLPQCLSAGHALSQAPLFFTKIKRKNAKLQWQAPFWVTSSEA